MDIRRIPSKRRRRSSCRCCLRWIVQIPIGWNGRSRHPPKGGQVSHLERVKFPQKDYQPQNQGWPGRTGLRYHYEIEGNAANPNKQSFDPFSMDTQPPFGSSLAPRLALSHVTSRHDFTPPILYRVNMTKSKSWSSRCLVCPSSESDQ